MRKREGVIIVNSIEVATTQLCPHCGNHFVSMKGSGVERAFCFRCNAVTCGSKECDACVTFEQKLDLYEKGKLTTL